MKRILSLFLAFIFILSPLEVFAQGNELLSNGNMTIIPAIEGIRSEMKIVDNNFCRVVSTTDVKGNYIVAKYDKENDELMLCINGEKINLNDLNSTNNLRRSAQPSTNTKIGTYERTCEPYLYSTCDYKQTITWQGIERVSYAWVVTGGEVNQEKTLMTSNYSMPSQFGVMMNAVNELRNQNQEMEGYAAAFGIEIVTFFIAASLGIGAIETLFFAAGMLETTVIPMLYGPDGLQTKIDACEIAYLQYDQ